MSALLTSLLAALLAQQTADSLALSGVVVDSAGKPVSHVEVVLAGRILAEGSISALARTRTDDQGAFGLELDRQRLKGIGPIGFLWAYDPGRTVGIQRVELTGTVPLPSVRLTLGEPFKRTLRVLDSEGRPVAGVRLAPVLMSDSQGSVFPSPDDRLERLTVITGADGVATLACLPVTIDPVTLRVRAPGIVPHLLPLPPRPGSDQFTLKLGRPARLAGSVFYDSGEPAANVIVEVWVQNPVYLRRDSSERKSFGIPSPIHFDSGPLRSRADGSFETPQQVMTGSSYRIMIRPDGGALVTSDWLPATTELTSAPPLRLRTHRKLLGLVQDREGLPIGGARVYLPSRAQTTTTNENGRFLLEGDIPERTYLLVQATGFRFQGGSAATGREPTERKLTLTRTSEHADHMMVPEPAPISPEESRALARRVLEPYLQATLNGGDDSSRWDCLRLLAKIDPARVLQLLPTAHFQNPGLEPSLRSMVAVELIATDPVESESIVASIALPADQVYGYWRLAAALPPAERDRKRALLARATVQVHAPAGGGNGARPWNRLAQLARVARGWLDLGDVERARPLIDEGLKMLAGLPLEEQYQPNFLPTAARLELDPVLSVIRDLSKPRRRDCYVAIAAALASERPAEAERVFRLVDDAVPNPAMSRSHIALWLCGPMARVDSKQAERLIAELKTPGEEACGWALLAYALVDRDRPAAHAALNHSIQLIDGLLERPLAANPPARLVSVFTNPAASILPIVEKVASERLEEVFWKAVALMPRDDFARERGFPDLRVAGATIFLARYDRQVALVFLSQATASAPVSMTANIRFVASIIQNKTCIDPIGAVAMFESLRAESDKADALIDRSRLALLGDLIESLIEPSDEHWKHAWRGPSPPFDKPFP
jgi:hypothetical protein